MIVYQMRNIDARKAELIKMLADAPEAETELPAIDRILIADLVISGIEKMMKTLDAHLDLVAPSLHTESSVHAFAMLQFMEVAQVARGVVDQMGVRSLQGVMGALESLAPGSPRLEEVRAAVQNMPEGILEETLAEMKEFLGVDDETHAMLVKRIKDLGL